MSAGQQLSITSQIRRRHVSSCLKSEATEDVCSQLLPYGSLLPQRRRENQHTRPLPKSSQRQRRGVGCTRVYLQQGTAPPWRVFFPEAPRCRASELSWALRWPGLPGREQGAAPRPGPGRRWTQWPGTASGVLFRHFIKEARD